VCLPPGGVHTFLHSAPVDDGRLRKRRAHRPVHEARFFVVGDGLLVEPALVPVTADVDDQALDEPLVETIIMKRCRQEDTYEERLRCGTLPAESRVKP